MNAVKSSQGMRVTRYGVGPMMEVGWRIEALTQRPRNVSPLVYPEKCWVTSVIAIALEVRRLQWSSLKLTVNETAPNVLRPRGRS